MKFLILKLTNGEMVALNNAHILKISPMKYRSPYGDTSPGAVVWMSDGERYSVEKSFDEIMELAAR